MSDTIKRTKPVMFYVTPALHAALAELARREDESVAALLRRASRQMVEAARQTDFAGLAYRAEQTSP